MADLGNLHFGVHLKDFTDAEADKIKKKLESLSVHLKIDGKNVTISQTDLIKKQIEDAIKSVSVQSVKIDTNAVRAQMNTALQGLNPQVSVSIAKGALSNDLQNYLNTKAFTVGITITRGNAQNAINTAFANISVPVNVTVSASAALQQLRQSLANQKVKIGIEAKDVNDFIADVEKRLKGRKIKVDVEPNQQHLVQAMRQALQGVSVKAQVKVDVDAQAITNAVQRAINNAKFTYHPNGGSSRSGGGSSRRSGGSSSGWNPNAERGLYESARASLTLGSSLRTNIRLAGELGTSLGNLVSIFGIKDLVANVVRIGGELENQKIALGAILQDGGKATEMFSKIQNLAVKSPFGIMDLNKYSKQLAAYGIEYNELYDTMKRMADISAGVGVDMGRIILAFGQVRAAGFLKGTELRQFTEANIPMVQALADRFSVLEKRIVSAGEVYDMISEKKVSFEDVKAVLWELTGEGGRFNNMQEVLSESLASKWKNLSDAIDVMYGKIAEGTIGDWAKNLTEGLTEVTKQWEYVATAIKSAAAAYLVYKNQMNGKQAVLNAPMNNLLASKQKEAEKVRLASLYRNLTSAEEKLLRTTNELNIADMKRAIRTGELNRSMAVRLIQLKQVDAATARYLVKLYAIQQQELQAAVKTNIFRSALTGLWTTIKGVGAALKTMVWNPFTGLFLAFSAVAEVFTYYNKKAEEVKQRNEDVAESAKGSAESLERELVKIKDMDISKMNTDEIKIKIKELTTVIKNEAFGWQGILDDVFAKEADDTFTHSAAEQLKMLKEKIDEIAEAKKALAEDNEIYSNVIGATESGGIFGLGSRDVVDAIKAYNKAVDENDKKLRSLGLHLRDVVDAVNFAASDNGELTKLLSGQSPINQVTTLKDYEDEWKKFKQRLSEINVEASKIVETWDSNIENVTGYTVGGYLEVLLHKFRKARAAMVDELTLTGEDVNNLSEKASQAIFGFVETLIKEGEAQKPRMKQFLYDWWAEAFNIDWVDLGYIVPPNAYDNGNKEEYDASKDEVAKLWKKRAEEIDKAVKMYDQWKKLEGTEKARTRVQTKDELANLFSGVYGFKLDLENPTAAYEFIQSKLNKNLSAQKELMVQLGVKISEAEFKDAQDKLKANIELLKREAEKIIQGWDLYKKLFEATGDKNVSMNIAFGKNIGFKDKLTHLRSQIETEMGKIGATIPFEKLIGMDTKDLESKGLGGLSDLIEKYNRENAKLKEESVKNFIDIIEASKDFAAQIEDIERNLEKDLKDLRANANGADTSRAEAQLRKNAAEAISKVNFEEFKQSSDWIRVFDDLNRVSDSTLDNMITKIEDFARHGKMSEEVTKQIVNAMAKLRKETIERNPFKGFEDAWKRLKYFKGLSSKVGEYDEHGKLITQQMVDDGIAEANDDLEKSSLAVADKFQAVANAADLLGGLFEGLGVDLGALGDMFSGTASGAQTGAGIASAFGVAGPWGAIAGAAVGLLSSVFAQHDKALQKEIEASEAREKAIKNMADNIEAALSGKLGGIYSMKLDDETRKELVELKNAISLSVKGASVGIGFTYSDETRNRLEEALREDSVYDAQLASLMAQRDEIREQMRLEEEKKNADDAKMADYEQALKEMDVAIADFAKDMANALYGIDFKNWASQLSEALVDAWASGEDAVTAYKDTVDEILKDLGVSIITQKIIEPMLEDTMNEFYAQFSKDNGKITDTSLEILTGMYDEAENAAKATEAYLKALEMMGIDVKDTADESSGGLSKGIQSVTEDTANLLGSYLNSIRQSVSVKQHLVEKLIGEDIPKINYLAEAQLRELSQIQTNTARNVVLVGEIRDLVNRVVDKGTNKLKV